MFLLAGIPAGFQPAFGAEPEHLRFDSMSGNRSGTGFQRARAAPSRKETRHSLWKGKIYPIYQFPFKPHRPVTEGDIIHVLVQEQSTATITANTDLKRTVEFDAELNDFINFNGISNALRSSGVTPGIDFSSERRNKGQSRRNRRDDMTFKIAAIVAWDLGDGTLFITARKEKIVHDEKTVLTLSGYVRRDDITSQRLVLSDYIHDLHLAYTGSGSITSNYTKSIWGKVLDWIWF